MQQCEQKSEPVLLIIGRLQSLNTSFKVSTLGCPNIECQVAKEIELLETCVYNRSISNPIYRIGNRI